jgi:hypothetical protein
LNMSWRCMVEWRYSSILDLGNRWRSVVTLTPRRLYSQENRPQHPLCRRLVGPQSGPAFCGVETNLLPLPSIKPWPSSL